MPNETAPRNPSGASPLRRLGSIRRTSNIDMTWPDGIGTPMLLEGRARDALTNSNAGPPLTISEATMTAVSTLGRVIQSLDTNPQRLGTAKLIGARAGSHLRETLRSALPEDRTEGTPLYLLLDDLSGTTLIGGWAWSRWVDNWQQILRDNAKSLEERRAKMENVCIGFASGSSALRDETVQSNSPVPLLQHPQDPDGWHPLREHHSTSMRRARRIDVWLDGSIQIDAAFQDSASVPDGGRVAIHEYRLSATADPVTQRLLTVKADPRVLPYRECPGAIHNTGRLVGTRLSELREVVLEELRKTAGCTHLNDALRALAEVPRLLKALPAEALVT